MSRKLKFRAAQEGRSPRGLLRGLGRLALWSAVGLVMVRGAEAVLASSPASDEELRFLSPPNEKTSDAFAVRFARLYLANPTVAALRPMLVPGASIGADGVPAPTPRVVEQVTVVASRDLGAGRSILTVACELQRGAVRYLAIPLVQDANGGVAALGLPAPVAGPGVSSLEAERTEPLSGPDAEEIAELVDRFLPIYLTADSAADYAYLLAPGAQVAPLGADEYTPLGTPNIRQLGGGEGPHRRVLATIRLRGADGGIYPVAYRLDLIRRDRWYLAAIEGEIR